MKIIVEYKTKYELNFLEHICICLNDCGRLKPLPLGYVLAGSNIRVRFTRVKSTTHTFIIILSKLYLRQNIQNNGSRFVYFFFLKLFKTNPSTFFASKYNYTCMEKKYIYTYTSVSLRNSVMFIAKQTCPHPHGLLNALDSCSVRLGRQSCVILIRAVIWVVSFTFLYNHKTKRIFYFSTTRATRRECTGHQYVKLFDAEKFSKN